jgi:poly(hydroxyalkanoate) depolymerase family esterase
MVTKKHTFARLLSAKQLKRVGPALAGGVRQAAARITALIRRIGRDGSEPAEDAGRRPSKHERGPSDAGPSKPFGLKRLVHGWRRRDSASEVARSRATVVEGRPGEFASGFYANEAGARPYMLYIPTSHAQQRLPLVVMLHGCTQTALDFANGTQMNAVAEERQFFVLYPEQTTAANRLRCWNWFKRRDQRRDHGEPAILAGMTREVMRRYRIDEGKVYLAGMSGGGAMASVMAAAYPDIYAAVGVHSGLALVNAHDLASAIAAMRGLLAPKWGDHSGSTAAAVVTPTIVFHGDRDRTVHPRNGEHLVSRSLQQNGASSTNASIERARAPGGHPYRRAIYRDSAGRVVLENWLVHGGGHAWFGGSPRGSYTDQKGPDASREMIRFFYESASKERSYDRAMGLWAA